MREIEYRSVHCFDKGSDELTKEIPLRSVTLARLREIFHADPDDPMFEVWDVDVEQAAQLQPYLSEPLDLDRYDCFLDCRGIWVNENRFIRFEDKVSRQQGILPLNDPELGLLQKALGVGEEEPLHDEYPIAEHQLKSLQGFVDGMLNPERFTYRLCCEVEEVNLSDMAPEDRPVSQPKHGLYLAPRELPGFPNLKEAKPKTPAARR